MRLNPDGHRRRGFGAAVRSLAPRIALALAPGLALGLAATAGAMEDTVSYEPLPILKASDFVKALPLKGENYEVEEKVTSDGLFNTYTINAPFGTFEAHSNSLVLIRMHEMDAIAQLKAIDKIAVAAGAAVESAVNMGKGTLHLITNPVETAQGIGGAASRLFGRIGRSATRSQEKLEAGGSAADAEKSTGTKVAETSQGIAKDLLGANKAQRFWAAKLFVDPYTHNQVLRDELEEVADYDAGGRFSTKLLPIGLVGTVLGTANTVNKLVYMDEPDALVTLNEKRLEAMGISPEDSRAFRLNKSYTLTVQTRLVASLDVLPEVSGRPEYVAQAATAAWEVDARFFQEGAYMAELYQRQESPIIGIVPDLPGACVIAQGDRFACLYPVDYIVWTEGMAGFVDRATRWAQTNAPKARRELLLTGRVSPRTAQELQKRGWTVREKAMYVLPAAPEPPPTVTK